MEPCPLNLCDGSGMRDVYTLKTTRRTAGGGCTIDKVRITREQSQDLTPKIDWKDQTIESGAVMCQMPGAKW